METEENEKEVLMTFLSFPLVSTNLILEKFSKLDGAIIHKDRDKRTFIYVPGSRNDRVVLVAHCDTVWDSFYNSDIPDPSGNTSESLLPMNHKPVEIDGIIKQGDSPKVGIGGDDRCGCAMLWLLRNSGHSLLICDGEECGEIGSGYLIDNFPDLTAELNDHCYFLELDHPGKNGFKTCGLPVTDEFCNYLTEQTGLQNDGSHSKTDIINLCRRICGANLTVGYYKLHSKDEYVVYDDWFHTLQVVRTLLQKEQPKFMLKYLYYD